MYQSLDKYRNKKILIWGYGREGKSTEAFLKRLQVTEDIHIFEGTIDGFCEDDYDYIIKSPGIRVEECSEKYTSQTQIFLEEHRDKVIGITGTKGKSTTSTMMYHVLSHCTDKKVILLGNIGEPCLNSYDEIDEDTYVVFEMSCHQLAHTTVSPHVAVFLNLFEEHLDYYGTLEKYFTAKSHVATYQKPDDYFYVGSNVPHIDTTAQVHMIEEEPKQQYKLQVLGAHNQINAHCVAQIATEVFGCDMEAVRESLKTFEGLAHRLQKIGTIDGIDYYDDSISTIPEATISAVHSIPNSKVILVGGMDRMIDYDILIDFIKERTDLIFICMYASGERIYKQVQECAHCIYVPDLDAALEKVPEYAKAGDACVLSPAAASYGYFKNFEERGDYFREKVLG